MNGILDSGAFIIMWFGFTLLMMVVILLVFLWGIRTRQFTDQDRARYLPLDTMPPEYEKRDGVGR